MTISPDAHGTVDTNGVTLAWEAFGSPTDPAVLLVMGLGAQMLIWPDGFCRALADAGRYVVRFDNRDVGLSSPMSGTPDIAAAMGGDYSSASYRLEDMADDTAGLLDALGLAPVHLVGASMGGMIAQTLTIRHPKVVRTLTSIMSTTSPGVGGGTQAAMGVLMMPAATTREEAGDRSVQVLSVIGSPAYPLFEPAVREVAGRCFDRAHDPLSGARQLLAIWASGDRTAALAEVTAPTLVIHGVDDPLVQIAGGRATAAAIPGAELVEIAGMGHDLPPQLWGELVTRIAAHTADR